MPPPRVHVDRPLAAGVGVELPPGPSRHVQVLRLQPGDALTLFDGRGGEWRGEVASIGRREVTVEVIAHDAVERELPVGVTLALGMPANDRMDFVIEKATELGAAAIQPLVCERSVLRPDEARAAKKVAHWRGLAIAAAEQCGRTRLPRIEPVKPLTRWLDAPDDVAAPAGRRWLLGFAEAEPLVAVVEPPAGRSDRILVLSGPEGGLSPDEERLARAAGFSAVSLGPRVLRADTAPLAVLAWIGLGSGAR